MLGFPPYISLTDLLALGIFVFGVFGSLQAFFDWRKLIRERRAAAEKGEPAEKESLQLILMTIIAPIFVVFGLLAFVFDNWETYRYRNLELTRITKATIQKVDDEYSSGQMVWYDDLGRLRDGLSLLSRCSSEVTKNHEHFQDGYRIGLFVNGSDQAEYFVTSYNRTSASTTRAGIKAAGDGAFSCRPFQDWVNANFAPMFRPSK